MIVDIIIIISTEEIINGSIDIQILKEREREQKIKNKKK